MKLNFLQKETKETKRSGKEGFILLRFLCLLLLSLPFLARAQSPGIYTLGNWNGGTNVIAASSTNSFTDTIAVSEFDNVGIQVTCMPVTTSTGTVLFNFALSLDSTSYKTVPSQVLTVTLAGTNTVTKVNNFSIPSAGTLRLASVANANAIVMTNVIVKIRMKSPKVTSR